MEEVESMSNTARKEANVSFTTLNKTRRPSLHFVSEEKGGSDVEDDKAADRWQWTTGMLRGWLNLTASSYSARLCAAWTGRTDIKSCVSRLRRGVRNGGARTMIKHALIKTTAPTAPTKIDVGYTCDDYKRLQAECEELKQQQDSLLDRIHQTEFEMELQLNSVVHTLESNNTALKETAEQLRSSQAMIQYLQSVILTKDVEIHRLRKEMQVAESDRPRHSQELDTIPVHHSDSESSMGSLMFAEEVQ